MAAGPCRTGRHGVDLISIGNGTGSRETDQLVGELMRKHPELKISKVITSEAGASVYSASALAAREFPDLDVSLRGAVSIARRLQDPLAELVKITPKSIGVGQYQHDVNQGRLARSLDATVEDCVNAVGVDVNTASVSLLQQVPRLGDKTYQLAAGFLRITQDDNPLDASAVHPEAYPVVEKILEDTGKSIRDLIGQSQFLRKLDPARYTTETFGLPTVVDILQELEKPGRDPRPEFHSIQYKEGVEKISDLEVGMSLSGVVTNVANFGAFVDIGVHQDGLVHISQLADRFVRDPRDVVKTGDLVRVKVLEVDVQRKRISLSMKNSPAEKTTEQSRKRPNNAVRRQPDKQAASAMANAFAKAAKS